MASPLPPTDFNVHRSVKSFGISLELHNFNAHFTVHQISFASMHATEVVRSEAVKVKMMLCFEHKFELDFSLMNILRHRQSNGYLVAHTRFENASGERRNKHTSDGR